MKNSTFSNRFHSYVEESLSVENKQRLERTWDLFESFAKEMKDLNELIKLGNDPKISKRLLHTIQYRQFANQDYYGLSLRQNKSYTAILTMYGDYVQPNRYYLCLGDVPMIECNLTRFLHQQWEDFEMTKRFLDSCLIHIWVSRDIYRDEPHYHLSSAIFPDPDLCYKDCSGVRRERDLFK